MILLHSLAAQVITKFSKEEWTLAAVESCTGGLLSDSLTDIDGSSKIFLGGIVAYSPLAKLKFCGVKQTTLIQFGTVSSQITAELCESIKNKLSTSVGIAITGIAGSSIENKPKGLVFIGISSPKGISIEELHFQGDRRKIKEQAVYAALQALLNL